MILTAVVVPVLLGIALLATDLGKVYVMKTRLQSVCDLAVMAAMRTFHEEEHRTRQQVYTSAKLVVQQNQFEIESREFDLGAYKKFDGKQEPEFRTRHIPNDLSEIQDPEINAARLTLKHISENTFAQLLGQNVEFKAQCIAVKCSDGTINLEGVCNNDCNLTSCPVGTVYQGSCPAGYYYQGSCPAGYVENRSFCAA